MKVATTQTIKTLLKHSRERRSPFLSPPLEINLQRRLTLFIYLFFLTPSHYETMWRWLWLVGGWWHLLVQMSHPGLRGGVCPLWTDGWEDVKAITMMLRGAERGEGGFKMRKSGVPSWTASPLFPPLNHRSDKLFTATHAASSKTGIGRSTPPHPPTQKPTRPARIRPHRAELKRLNNSADGQTLRLWEVTLLFSPPAFRRITTARCSETETRFQKRRTQNVNK